MKITNIKQQVKRADRYSIYVDEKYAFSLSENELIKQGLRIGREFTIEELEKIKNDAVLDKARMRAIDQLSRRMRSEWELRDYLKRKDYEKEIVDTVIDYLRERGYVDDAAFARRWVENRRLLKSVSKRRLTQELKQKRVADEHIAQSLEYDETDEKDVLRGLVERKRKQTKYQDEMKLMQYLSRQGFSYDDIKTVLAELSEES